MNKTGAIIMFVIVSANLVKLIFHDGYSGGKVYVESNTYTIIMMLILIGVLGYFTFKSKE